MAYCAPSAREVCVSIVSQSSGDCDAANIQESEDMVVSSWPRSAGRFVVTPKGHADLLEAQTCECAPRLDGLLLTCRECGTVFGYLREEPLWTTSRNGKPD